MASRNVPKKGVVPALVAESPLSISELDRRVEHWLSTHAACNVDFEIDDAVQKLHRLGLVEESGQQLSAQPLNEAIATLDARWDALYNQ